MDAICIALYCVIMGFIKTRDSIAVLVAFFISALYSASPLFDYHDAYANHIVISLCFIPALYFTCKNVTIPLMLYIVYHWVVSGDYIFFSSTTTIISSTFIYVTPTLNLIIMLGLIYARRDHDYTRTGLVSGWLPNLFHNFRNNKKMERR